MTVNIAKASKNLFLKNMLAYLVLVLMTPVLTRLYDPGQFGTLSLMIFVSSLLGVLFTARLELAFPLIKERLSLNNLIMLLIYFAFLCCIIASMIVFLFKDEILNLFVAEKHHGNWLLIIPFYGLALSISSILMLFLTKEKQFSKMGLSLLIQNCAFCLIAVILSKFNFTLNGLIVAKCFGLGVSILFVSITLRYKIKELIFSRLKFKFSKKITRDLKQFVQFNLPISIMGIIGKDLMVLIFAFSQGVAYAGFYAIARVIGELPTSMLSGALGPVFYSQTASSLNDLSKKNMVLDEINVILKLLFTVMIPVYLVLSIWAVEIFKFSLGETWEISGTIFLFLLPLSIISLFSCWLTRLFEVMGRQKISFKIQFTFEVIGFVVALALIYFEVQLEIILAFIVTCFSFVPMLITLFSFKMLGFKASSIKLVAILFILFSLINALVVTNFSNNLNENTQSIWLIFSSALFFLLGQRLFKDYRLRDLNVFR